MNKLIGRIFLLRSWQHEWAIGHCIQNAVVWEFYFQNADNWMFLMADLIALRGSIFKRWWDPPEWDGISYERQNYLGLPLLVAVWRQFLPLLWPSQKQRTRLTRQLSLPIPWSWTFHTSELWYYKFVFFIKCPVYGILL